MTYRRIRRLGAGYFGEVWLEEDTALNRLCAAKYLNPDFLLANQNPFAEAQTMVSVEHENIVQVYSADATGDRPVIRMEYLPAGSVENAYEGKPVPVLDAISLLEEACRGIEFLHSKEVLHRDIKPANLLLSGPKRVKVGDFGLSCHAGSTTTAPPWFYTAHLPPESIDAGTGIEDFTGDVYALGVTAYRLLNGDHRFAEIRGYAEWTPHPVCQH